MRNLKKLGQEDNLLRQVLRKLNTSSGWSPYIVNGLIRSIGYSTDRGSVTISVSDGKISVSARCCPSKEGWSFSQFKATSRGISCAVRRAEAEKYF
jgi:hypothetical protein